MFLKKWSRNLLATILRHGGSLEWREKFVRKLHKKFFFNMREKDNFVLAKLKDGSKLSLDLRMECLSFYLGEYEPENLRVLLTFLPSEGTFIDIGANIGFFSVPVAHRRRETQGRVYAFEPIPANYSELLKNIRLNGLEGKIIPSNLAISNFNGRLRMQIFASDCRQTANAVPLTNWAGYPTNINCEVDAVRFDDWIKGTDIDRIDVMKIDVEGHEVHVFEGMMETLSKYRPVIYSECNAFFFKQQGLSARRVVELLDPLGYEFYKIIGGRLKNVAPVPEDAQDLFLLPRQ
jgi:FkbM family methyltransferase